MDSYSKYVRNCWLNSKAGQCLYIFTMYWAIFYLMYTSSIESGGLRRFERHGTHLGDRSINAYTFVVKFW